MDQQQELVHAFTKNDHEEIRISLRKYKNRLYIDLRLYFLPEGAPEMVPSKKGLTVGAEFAPEIKRALFKFEEALRHAGEGGGGREEVTAAQTQIG